MVRPRLLVVTLCAFLFAGTAGWLIGGLFDPTHAQIRAAAEALVPEGAIVTARAENTGHPLIVGDYFASLEFVVPDPINLDPVLVEHSRALGYGLDRVDVKPGATIREVVRKPMRAVLRALTVLTDEGHARGTIRVEADPESRRDRRLVGAVLGGLAAGGVVLLLGRLRVQRG